MSYVQAVKLAVTEMERYPMYDGGWFWGNNWRRYMIIPPKLTLHREI